MRKTTTIAIALMATALTWGYSQAATEQYNAKLTGAAEVPPVTSPGTGTAAVALDTASKQISYTVTYSGLTATAAHIHCGAAPGANAGVAVKFDNPASPIKGTATLTDAQLADLQGGRCYVNIHTDANKGGELRGQLMK